ncbi:hypothetical protein V1477_000022 [Vespula maculifrons]|uniref:Uncharacterized protein n=1 Tax=Vespula maculifrons TaxID=7453 RepID=A0ABD2D306_VESMC
MESLIDFDSYASSLPLYFDESTSKDRQDIFSVSNNKNGACVHVTKTKADLSSIVTTIGSLSLCIPTSEHRTFLRMFFLTVSTKTFI